MTFKMLEEWATCRLGHRSQLCQLSWMSDYRFKRRRCSVCLVSVSKTEEMKLKIPEPNVYLSPNSLMSFGDFMFIWFDSDQKVHFYKGARFGPDKNGDLAAVGVDGVDRVNLPCR